jgi:UDPglucose--hexose-1-phosphate uridylyltransferase
VIAPERAARPGAAAHEIEPATPAELDECPFDGGREGRTAPETLRLPAEGPWRVRVVRNLYPAFERHEVVVHTPEHVRAFADLPPEQLELVAEAWRRRRAVEPDGYLFACVNEGRAAGASLPHTHSQLVWLPETPPAVSAEHGIDRLLDGEVVLEAGGLVAVSPPGARVPYELRIAPVEPEPDAFAGALANALVLLGEVVARLRELEGHVPFNAWLHDGAHWHLHLVPRLTVPAGLELGAGIDVNPLPPEEAARRLREVSPRHATPPAR